MLENHGDIAVFGRDVVLRDTIKRNCASIRRFQASNEAKSGGFAATGGADNDQTFTVVNEEVQIFDRADRPSFSGGKTFVEGSR